jgi:hypothetical protein
MNLDIRIPIGMLFTVLGVLLVAFGVATMAGAAGGNAIYERSLGLNINLISGIVMLVFGLLMYFAGRQGTSAVKSADESPEGRKLEEAERAREASERPRGH